MVTSVSKMTRNIPENDVNHPRWLLDIKDWCIYPYAEVRSQVESTGYGIVSYTWGMWADFDEPAEHVPGNLLWNIPTVEGLPLAHCREVLDNTMDIRFMWWDWMCVPQGKRGKRVTLDDELEQVKGQEIAKQMYVIPIHQLNESIKLLTGCIGQYTRAPKRAWFGYIARSGMRIQAYRST